MRILVTGSRDWTDVQAIEQALYEVTHDHEGFHCGLSVVVVHGNCRGADAIAGGAAHLCARANTEAHPAENHGSWPSCGPRRNAHMVSLGADICLAFPMPGSKGTWDLIRKAADEGIPVRIFPGRKEVKG